MPKHSHLLLALTALICASLCHATITGYSNTLSSYIASATGVTSTYTFTPLSGVANAFKSIEITQQGFSAASSPLAATCNTLASLPIATMSRGVGASQTATFAFQTSTPLAVDGKISLTFPSGLVTAVAATKSCEMVPTPITLSSTDASKITSDNLLVIDVKVAVPAGLVTVTCSGLTFAATPASTAKLTAGVSSLGVAIGTSSDTITAHVSTLAIGQVTAAFNALTLSSSVGPSGSASVTFGTATAFTAHESNNQISMTFPAGYITAQAANLCGISVPNAVTTSSFGNDKLVLIVKTALAATAVTVTCTGLNLAANPEVAATVGGSTGLIIETSSDKQPAYVTVPAIGAIRQPTLTMTQAVGAGGVATISFFTSTKLIPSSANQITLTFPSGVTAQGDNLCAVTSSETISTSKFSAGVITMKLATYSTLPLGNVVITCTGLTLAAQPEQAATVGQATGLKIQTSVDTTAAFATIPAIGAVKNAVGNFPVKAVGTADQTATITFTTSTALAIDDSIELLFPADLIEANAADKCVITGAAEAAKSTFAAPKITIKVKAALAAGPVTVTCTELKLKAKAATEAADGLAITTSKDTIPAKVATPATGAITAASLIIGKAVGTADQTATITFTTSTALAVDAEIELAFPADLIEANDANKCVVVGAAKAAESTFAAPKITVKVKAALAAGPVTVTCTELKLKVKAGTDAAAGLAITTLLKDTIPAKVATPATGIVSVGLASTSPALSATFEAKTLKITAEVDVWTIASAPVVTCIVSSFTNAALASTSRRSLLQTNQVEIEVKNSAGATVGTKLSTGQTFPESIATPITRSLYLPKASGNANGIAWVCVSFSVLLFWL